MPRCRGLDLLAASLRHDDVRRRASSESPAPSPPARDRPCADVVRQPALRRPRLRGELETPPSGRRAGRSTRPAPRDPGKRDLSRLTVGERARPLKAHVRELQHPPCALLTLAQPRGDCAQRRDTSVTWEGPIDEHPSSPSPSCRAATRSTRRKAGSGSAPDTRWSSRSAAHSTSSPDLATSTQGISANLRLMLAIQPPAPKPATPTEHGVRPKDFIRTSPEITFTSTEVEESDRAVPRDR